MILEKKNILQKYKFVNYTQKKHGSVWVEIQLIKSTELILIITKTNISRNRDMFSSHVI